MLQLTIRLALYIYITVQSKLGSSRAMHDSDVWIETLAIFISRRCDLFR